MTKGIYSLLFIYPILLLSVGCVSTGKYKKLEGVSQGYLDKLESSEDRINQLDEQLADLEKEKMMLESSNKDLTEALNAEKGELSKKVANLNSEKLDLEKKVAEIEKEKDALKKEQRENLFQMKKDHEDLVKGLQEEVEAGQVTITQLEGKLTVNVADKIFFDSGKTQLNKSGKEVLFRLADVIKGLEKKQVVIEGHTDNAKIGPSLREKFPTNWELSTSRATEVVRFLEEKGGIEPYRLIAVGYGSSRPVADNATPKGKAKNRRIEIIFQDKDWKKVETSKPSMIEPGEDLK
ncbi:hypothetical protein BVX98_07350 [bacterium F11]|nr:hypothetical protein BVX98_07350 [bacterium F11]